MYDSPAGTLACRLNSSNTRSRIAEPGRVVGQRPRLQRVVEERAAPGRARSRRSRRASSSGSRAASAASPRRRGSSCKYGDVTDSASSAGEAPAGQFRRDPLTGEWVNIVGHRQARPNLPTRRLPVLYRWLGSARCVRRALVSQPVAGVRARRARSTSATARGHPSRGGRRRGRAVLARARRVARDPRSRAGSPRSSTCGRNERPRSSSARRSSTCSCSRTAVARSARPSTIRTARSTAIRSFRPRRRARSGLENSARCAVISRPSSTRARASSPGTATGWHGCRSRRGTRTACASRRGRTSRRCPRSTTNSATTSRACSSTCSARYDRLWPEMQTPFPYLLWFHQAPAGGGDAWHVHAHVAPPLRAPGVPRFVASGELGSGTLSNPGRSRRRRACIARCLTRTASARRAAST